MKKNILKFVSIIALGVLLLAPAFAGAQTTTTTTTYTAKSAANCYEFFQSKAGGGKTLGKLFEYGTCIISTAIIPLIFAIATVVFIWGVVQYVINSEDEAKKDKGRQFMIWGLIGLFVMLCVWGLVAIIGNTFGVDTTFVPKVKQQQ